MIGMPRLQESEATYRAQGPLIITEKHARTDRDNTRKLKIVTCELILPNKKTLRGRPMPGDIMADLKVTGRRSYYNQEDWLDELEEKPLHGLPPRQTKLHRY